LPDAYLGGMGADDDGFDEALLFCCFCAGVSLPRFVHARASTVASPVDTR
jgi:hypothetical protein